MNTLERYFVKWISISFVVAATIGALPALSADVFVDEGDVDFDTTPIGGPAPASDPSAVAQTGTEEGAVAPPSGGPIEDLGSASDLGLDPSTDPQPEQPVLDPAPPPVPKANKKPVKSKKSVAKKSGEKKPHGKKGKQAKSSKQHPKKSAKKSKKSKVASAKAGRKRAVASSEEFAGGRYRVTKKECSLQTKPGSSSSIGSTRPDKKLWVEDSGNAKYWKVYGKDGSPAFVKKSCF